MKLLSDPPLPGEWFCFPQTVLRVAKYAPDPEAYEHRWIVAGRGFLDIDIPVLLRSTKSEYGGIPHEAHNCSCSSPNCRIDKRGWIRELRHLGSGEFIPERYSCDEPNEDIVDRVMAEAARMRKPPRTRKKGK